MTKATEAKVKTEKAKEEELRELTVLEASTNLEDKEYIDENGDKVMIPAGFAVSKVDGEDTVDNGLVVIDNRGNEWVWIEVPSNITEKAMTDDEIESNLINYTSEYKTGYSDDWYYGCGLEEQEYVNKYSEMLKSIRENGGFYIGRYEVGTFDVPVTDKDTNRTAVIKKGAYPYNYVTCSQAEKIVEELATGNRTFTLMFGIQWDLVLKYLEVNAPWDTTTNKAIYYLNTNSSSWGNYRNVQFSITEGAKYAIYSNNNLGSWNEVKTSHIKPIYNSSMTGMILSTGATERNSKMNIFDLSGNLWEWTLEKSDDIKSPCITRSGNYLNYGSGFPASSSCVFTITDNYHDVGFRAAFY